MSRAQRCQVVAERRTGPSDAELQPPDLRDAPLDTSTRLEDVTVPEDRELWTSLEAAAHLRFPTLNAFYQWVWLHKVPRERRGKVALYRRRDLEEALRKDPRRVAPARPLLVAHTRRRS